MRSSARRRKKILTLSKCHYAIDFCCFSFNFVALFIIIVWLDDQTVHTAKIMREKLTFWLALPFVCTIAHRYTYRRFLPFLLFSFGFLLCRTFYAFCSLFFNIFLRVWKMGICSNSKMKLAHKRSKGYLERIPIRSALHFLYSARWRIDWMHSIECRFSRCYRNPENVIFSQIFRAYLPNVSFVFLHIRCDVIWVEFGSGIQTFEHR